MPSAIRGALGKLPIHLRMVSLLDKILFFFKDKVAEGDQSHEGQPVL